MRQGVRLGVDPGSTRIGVARSDPGGMLATPVETVRRQRGDLDRIAELTAEHDAIEVIVGLPRSLSGQEGPASRGVREFAEALAARLAPVPVRLVDERLSTVAAERTLQQQGMRGRERRDVVDQAAATVILQVALDTERSTGSAPGEIIRGQA